MPVLFVNMKEQNIMTKEPYQSFTKRFNTISESLNGENIQLCVGKGKSGTFSGGFYTDDNYCKNPMLTFEFAEVNGKTENDKAMFVRMTYSYECDSYYDLDWQLLRIKTLKLRVPYFYIPEVSHFEFNSPIEDDIRFQFDVLVPDSSKVLQVCYSLINQVISIFGFED